MASGRYRLGVDVGGTFTDFVLADLTNGLLHTGKRLTTPRDPNECIDAGARILLDRTSVDPACVEVFVHATTLVTNTLIERSGAKTALITTSGFRDLLEMGFESRYDIYDLGLELPAPLVPRRLRMEVRERMDAGGEVLVPLDTEELRRVAGRLVDAGIEAVAVCLLNSYANPLHEEAIGQVLKAEFPELSVSLSCRVQPEIREFERVSTTVANAYVRPKVERYLQQLIAAVEGLGMSPNIQVMLSSGGIISPEQASIFPVRILESGPAAGAQAAAMLGAALGEGELVSFDMGGTTAKIGLIAGAEPMIANQFETAHLHRFKKGSGLTIKSPTVELIELGAGGGSIAHVEDKLVKVGPRSAGADPGPICYGRGGAECTVTDADLMLGYLDPDNFAGKQMALDHAAACAGIERLSTQLGLSPVETAWGIHEIANENMAMAARVHLIERGRDPASFALVAFGGAGPTHAQAVARKLGVRRIVIPRNAGVMSAVGLLGAPPRVDVVRTHIADLDEADWDAIDALLGRMIAEGRHGLSARVNEQLTVARFADMRYRGQGSEITVALPSLIEESRPDEIVRRRFFDTYDELYGRHLEGLPIEIINWRVRITGPSEPLFAHVPDPGLPASSARPAGSRQVYFSGTGFVASDIYERDGLSPGSRIAGPAIVQANEFAALLAPGQRCRVDDMLNLVIDVEDQRAAP